MSQISRRNPIKHVIGLFHQGMSICEQSQIRCFFNPNIGALSAVPIGIANRASGNPKQLDARVEWGPKR